MAVKFRNKRMYGTQRTLGSLGNVMFNQMDTDPIISKITWECFAPVKETVLFYEEEKYEHIMKAHVIFNNQATGYYADYLCLFKYPLKGHKYYRKAALLDLNNSQGILKTDKGNLKILGVFYQGDTDYPEESDVQKMLIGMGIKDTHGDYILDPRKVDGP